MWLTHSKHLLKRSGTSTRDLKYLKSGFLNVTAMVHVYSQRALFLFYSIKNINIYDDKRYLNLLILSMNNKKCRIALEVKNEFAHVRIYLFKSFDKHECLVRANALAFRCLNTNISLFKAYANNNIMF